MQVHRGRVGGVTRGVAYHLKNISSEKYAPEIMATILRYGGVDFSLHSR